METGKFLVFIGLLIVFLGVLLIFLQKIPYLSNLGKMFGDLSYQTENIKILNSLKVSIIEFSIDIINFLISLFLLERSMAK